MPQSAVNIDLKKLEDRAFERAEWAEDAIRRYHIAVPRFAGDVAQKMRVLYDWMFVPPTLWPFNIQDVLLDCLVSVEKGKRLTTRHHLVIDLLPEPPGEAICAAVADHERHIQKGVYENLAKTHAKYVQNELTTKADPLLRQQWERIKALFKVRDYCDHKGVIRRTMSTERNLRPSFTVKMSRSDDAFQAAFDAFCLRWNLYGMQNDEPLQLKLAVHLTPFGTMIHIPAYWSFDPKRDIRWDAIGKLHRVRVRNRQGSALAEGRAKRMNDAGKLRRLDEKALQLGLRGEKKHEFLCAGLGWDARTSPKRISRLRAEFKSR